MLSLQFNIVIIVNDFYNSKLFAPLLENDLCSASKYDVLNWTKTMLLETDASKYKQIKRCSYYIGLFVLSYTLLHFNCCCLHLIDIFDLCHCSFCFLPLIKPLYVCLTNCFMVFVLRCIRRWCNVMKQRFSLLHFSFYNQIQVLALLKYNFFTFNEWNVD